MQIRRWLPTIYSLTNKKELWNVVVSKTHNPSTFSAYTVLREGLIGGLHRLEEDPYRRSGVKTELRIFKETYPTECLVLSGAFFKRVYHPNGNKMVEILCTKNSILSIYDTSLYMTINPINVSYLVTITEMPTSVARAYIPNAQLMGTEDLGRNIEKSAFLAKCRTLMIYENPPYNPPHKI